MPWLILSSLGAKPHCCSYDVSSQLCRVRLKRFSLITHFMHMLFIFAHFFRWLMTNSHSMAYYVRFFFVCVCVSVCVVKLLLATLPGVKTNGKIRLIKNLDKQISC